MLPKSSHWSCSFAGELNAVAINATSQQNGSWDIDYYDPLVKAQMANSGPFFRPALKGYGSVQVKVENGVARIDD